MLVFLYTLQVSQKNQQTELAASPAASVFTSESVYTDIEGNPIRLDDYLGQTVIALAWASWCPSCGEQLKLLAAIADENSDIVTLAFNRGETSNRAQAFLEFFNIETNVQLVLDPDDNFFTSIEGYAMPELVIFDKQGNISHHVRGPISKPELESVLANM